MSKSKKAVIVASIFIVVGVIIVFLSFAINGFHFSKWFCRPARYESLAGLCEENSSDQR